MFYLELFPYLKEHGSQAAKRTVGEHFSSIQKSILKKHFVEYFKLTQEAKSCLAASLGIKASCLRKWMRRKLEKEKSLEIAIHQLQTMYKQQHGLNGPGIYYFTFIYW